VKPVIIFDLDGTLADQTHRQHHIQGEQKDWRAYFGACQHDAPIGPVLRIMRLLRNAGTECWVWTGRSAEVLSDTRRWLVKFDAVPNELRMRPAGDHRPDHELKAAWLEGLSRS
jgi:phosphoglycolate phosphatase-like HAD superfamily hydrolase